MSKMTTHPLRICLLPVFLLVTWGCSPSQPESMASDDLSSVAGTYATVSESEWSQELRLNANGTAELINGTWAPGDCENRLSYQYSGRWTLQGNEVRLQLLESRTSPQHVPRTETLRYEAELNLAEIGREEAAPGLINLNPRDDSPLWPGTMWRDDALRALGWP